MRNAATLKVPMVQGVIDRRILVNFRVDPDALADVLPRPFRPHTVRGWGVAGICLIRLEEIRPRFLPAIVGLSSENAAHRIAVEWDGPDGVRRGVYIPRRDTSSALHVFAGGRFFPGEHQRAFFDVEETPHWVSLSMRSEDRSTFVTVTGRETDTLPDDSVFASLAEASAFFQAGSLGYSDTPEGRRFDGLVLKTLLWKVTPMAVDAVESSFFSETDRFPPGSVHFDCALLMKGVPHEWHAAEPLCILE